MLERFINKNNKQGETMQLTNIHTIKEETQYVIEPNIPIPPSAKTIGVRASKWDPILSSFKINDSIQFSNKTDKTSFCGQAKKKKMRLVERKLGPSLWRVWRIA